MYNKKLKLTVHATTTFCYQGTDGPLKGVTITATFKPSGVADIKDLMPPSDTKVTHYEEKVQDILNGDTPIRGPVELKYQKRDDTVLHIAGQTLGTEVVGMKLIAGEDGEPEIRIKLKCRPVRKEVAMGSIHLLLRESDVAAEIETNQKDLFEKGQPAAKKEEKKAGKKASKKKK